MIEEESQKEYFQHLMHFLREEERAGKEIFPPRHQLFNALNKTPFESVKVVIIGQDPYHGVGQANGLAFSVERGVTIPPSLRNIFRALKKDYPDFIPPNHGDLTGWAEQGVLLLNSVLTVERGKPNAHEGLGWERFTDALIDQLNHNRTGVIFLLWGRYAQKKGDRIDRSRHTVLESVHPSPFSAHKGFFEAGHFRKSNEILEKRGLTPIYWDALSFL